jgi:transcriptional regulator with XRE-family HTH domain
MSEPSDGQIDQLVKARWREIGLSQTDLAEVLGALPDSSPKRTNDTSSSDSRRLMQLAKALGISTDFLDREPDADEPRGARPLALSALNSEPLHSLLELRLLRVFRGLQDHHTKRMLIDLIEQIVKRQATRPGDAS